MYILVDSLIHWLHATVWHLNREKIEGRSVGSWGLGSGVVSVGGFISKKCLLRALLEF